MQSVVEVVETIELPKLPHYYYNNSSREFVRVLPIFRYTDEGVLSTDEKDICALDVTIVPHNFYGYELKVQRFKISISNFSEIYDRHTGLAWTTLNDLIHYEDHYEKTKEEFDSEMEIAISKIKDISFEDLQEKDAGHP